MDCGFSHSWCSILSTLSLDQARPLPSLLSVQPLCTENGPPLPMVFCGFVLMYRHLSFLYRINNCVGFSNYKFFFLFLFYTMVLCLYIGLSSISDVIRAWVGINNFYTYSMSLFCCFFRHIVLEMVSTHRGFDLTQYFYSSCV